MPGRNVTRANPVLDDFQIQSRRPLWVALSELWLDTELSPDDLVRIARVMVASGLSLEQLRYVHQFEVAPAISTNLRSVAGQWACFDEDWLCHRIVNQLRKPTWRTRFWLWFPPTRNAMLRSTAQHWATLEELVRLDMSRS